MITLEDQQGHGDRTVVVLRECCSYHVLRALGVTEEVQGRKHQEIRTKMELALLALQSSWARELVFFQIISWLPALDKGSPEVIALEYVVLFIH